MKSILQSLTLASRLLLVMSAALAVPKLIAEEYTVKVGDTLASIARSHYGEPVFGPKGSIKKVYGLNPWAKTNSVIEPGQKVQLESPRAPDSAKPPKTVEVPSEHRLQMQRG